MNRPPLFSYLIGNPVSLLLITIICGQWLIRWWHGLEPPLYALIAAGILLTAMRAFGQLLRYHRWRRTWKSMQPPQGAGMLAKPGVRRLIAAGILLAAIAYLGSHQDNPDNQTALGLLLLCLLLLASIFALRGIYRLWQRRRIAAQASYTATPCLQQPPDPVPSLEQAYRQLPPHCARVLTPRSAR